jgi:sialidase-1
MRLLSEGTIYVGAAGTRTANCCFPAVVQLPKGTLVVSWRVGSQKDSSDGLILLSRSNDEGRSWSEPQELPAGPWTATPGEIHYAGLTVLGDNHLLAALMWFDRSNPARPLFNPVTEGILPVRTWLCESRDGGRSWGDYRVMDGEPHTPLTITGPVLVLDRQRLACQVEVNKSYEDSAPWRQAAAWKISHDGGYDWSEYVEVAKDPSGQVFYWDARYSVGANGHVLAALWCYDRKQKRDLPIHLCQSHDGGRTWSAPRDIGLVGQLGYPVLLGGGRLLLPYIDRYRSPSIRAALSNDLGGTFVEDVVVYRHQAARPDPGKNSAAADYLQDMGLWTFGRVEPILGIDGTVWLVYYASTAQATSSIHWARLQVSALRRTMELHPHLVGRTATDRKRQTLAAESQT